MSGYTYCKCPNCDFDVVDEDFCAFCDDAGCDELDSCGCNDNDEEYDCE